MIKIEIEIEIRISVDPTMGISIAIKDACEKLPSFYIKPSFDWKNLKIQEKCDISPKFDPSFAFSLGLSPDDPRFKRLLL